MVRQRLFSFKHAHISRYTATDGANGKYSTFTIKLHRLHKQLHLLSFSLVAGVGPLSSETKNTWERQS